VECGRGFSTGQLSLGGPAERALARCAAVGVTPVAVAGYGPPYANVIDLVVGGSTPLAPGTYSIPVTGPVDSVMMPTDYVMKGTTQVTARWAYYGSLIDSVDTSAGTVTLAAATTVTLEPGDILKVNRLRYAALPGPDLADPGVLAYMRYVTFLAERLGRHGPGYVCIWNEFAWAHDRWDSRAAFYDQVPTSLSPLTGLYAALKLSLGLSNLPPHVRLINDLSDKTGAEGIVSIRLPSTLGWRLRPTKQTVSHNIVSDDIHPYGNNPEVGAWNPLSTANALMPGRAYQIVNPAVDYTNNFPWMRLKNDRAHIGLRMFATECGTSEQSDERQAVYLLRRVASLWGMAVIPVVYTLNEATAFAVVKGRRPRQAYSALRTLATLVARLGGEGGQPEWVPQVSSYAELSWPLMSVGLHGKRGSLLLVWQRTWAMNTQPWDTIAPPSPGQVLITIPSHVVVEDIVVPRTGSRTASALSERTVTVPVTDDITAILCMRSPHPS
jgi:hypothetical protein